VQLPRADEDRAGGGVSDKSYDRLQDEISIHIFSVSAAMVGVCLTVIGIIRVIATVEVGTVIDDLLALDAIFFLASCLIAYGAMRWRARKRGRWLERVADGLFIVALSMMAVICGLIAYSVI
jgi:hypothetical protein